MPPNSPLWLKDWTDWLALLKEIARADNSNTAAIDKVSKKSNSVSQHACCCHAAGFLSSRLVSSQLHLKSQS